MKTEGQKNIVIKAFFYALILLIIYLAFKLFLGPLLPFLLAGALVLSLQPLVGLLNKKFQMKRNPTSIALVLAVYIIVIGLTAVTVRTVYLQLTDLIRSLPQYTDSVTVSVNTVLERMRSFLGKMPDIGGEWLKDIPSAALDTAIQKIGVFATDFAAGFAAGVPSFLLSLAVMIIASIYIAKDYSAFSNYMHSIIPERIIIKFHLIKTTVLSKVAKLIKGYLIIIVLTFFELFIGLLFLKVKYALIIALLTALIDILPVLGSGTVLIPWAVFSALSGNPARAIGLMLLYLVITVVRNITEPKIIGAKIGIHPVLTLAVIFLGLKLFGAAGVILAPLITVAVKSLLEIKYGQQSAPSEQKKPS